VPPSRRRGGKSIAELEQELQAATNREQRLNKENDELARTIDGLEQRVKELEGTNAILSSKNSELLSEKAGAKDPKDILHTTMLTVKSLVTSRDCAWQLARSLGQPPPATNCETFLADVQKAAEQALNLHKL